MSVPGVQLHKGMLTGVASVSTIKESAPVELDRAACKYWNSNIHLWGFTGFPLQ
jgi:hypothetical protein